MNIDECSLALLQEHKMTEVEIKGELVKCPNCGHRFDSHETFQWLLDMVGDPTIEYLACPKCGIATEPKFSCDQCVGIFEGGNFCELAEGGGCAAIACVNFDDFEAVEITPGERR